MKFKITIECDNAAFKAEDGGDNDPAACGIEVSEILYKFQRALGAVRMGDTWPLFDSNGNRVGEARVAR